MGRRTLANRRHNWGKQGGWEKVKECGIIVDRRVGYKQRNTETNKSLPDVQKNFIPNFDQQQLLGQGSPFTNGNKLEKKALAM